MPQATFFDSTQIKPGKLLFSITIPGRLSSWNDILGMEQWARYKFKQELADVFLYELRHTDTDSSTRTTFARSTMLTYADTLASYLAMRQAERRSKSAKKKLEAMSQKKPRSKSLKFVPSEPPPF